MPRLTNEQYRDLCTAHANDLTPGERRTALRWKAQQVQDERISGKAESLIAEHPDLSVDQAYHAARLLDVQPDDTWADMPPRNLHQNTSHASKYAPIVTILRSRPGKWRDLGVACASWRKARALAASIRHGDGAFKPKGSIDAKPIENPIGTYRVWASAVKDLS